MIAGKMYANSNTRAAADSSANQAMHAVMANAATVNGHTAGQPYETNELSMPIAAIIETNVTTFAARSIRIPFPVLPARAFPRVHWRTTGPRRLRDAGAQSGPQHCPSPPVP